MYNFQKNEDLPRNCIIQATYWVIFLILNLIVPLQQYTVENNQNHMLDLEFSFFLSFLLSGDIRSAGNIAIVKKFNFDFLMIFHSTSLPESKNVF